MLEYTKVLPSYVLGSSFEIQVVFGVEEEIGFVVVMDRYWLRHAHAYRFIQRNGGAVRAHG